MDSKIGKVYNGNIVEDDDENNMFKYGFVGLFVGWWAEEGVERHLVDFNPHLDG